MSSSGKPTLVVILSRFPYPLEKGDKLRAFNQLKGLSEKYNIELMCLCDKQPREADIEKVKPFCSNVHLFYLPKWAILLNVIASLINGKPFQVGYFYRLPHKRRIAKLLTIIKPDHIYAQLIRTSEYVKDYHACPKTLDYMDTLSMGMERRISGSNFIKRWFIRSEAKRLRIYERRMFEYFEHKTIISQQDRNFIFHPEKNKIECIPNGIDEKYFTYPEVEKDFDLVFVGNMGYAPNVTAALYLIQDIVAHFPDRKLLISGVSPNQQLLRAAEGHANVEVTGWVDDIRASYARGKIFVAPLMIGTGMQNKILEAMAMGLPCITTSLVNNAIGAKVDEEIIVAENTTEFIFEINRLLTDPALHQKIQIHGKNYAQENFTWKGSNEHLIRLMN